MIQRRYYSILTSGNLYHIDSETLVQLQYTSVTTLLPLSCMLGQHFTLNGWQQLCYFTIMYLVIWERYKYHFILGDFIIATQWRKSQMANCPPIIFFHHVLESIFSFKEFHLKVSEITFITMFYFKSYINHSFSSFFGLNQLLRMISVSLAAKYSTMFTS